MATATPAASIPLHPGATDLHSLTAPPLGENWFSTMAAAHLTPVGVGIHNVLIASDCSHHSNIAVRFGLSLDSYTERGLRSFTFCRLTSTFSPNRRVARCYRSRAARPAGLQVSVAQPWISRRIHRLSRKHVGGIGSRTTVALRPRPQSRSHRGRYSRPRRIGESHPGSVAEKIFRHSPIPVLTLGPNIHPRSQHQPDTPHPCAVRSYSALACCSGICIRLGRGAQFATATCPVLTIRGSGPPR